MNSLGILFKNPYVNLLFGAVSTTLGLFVQFIKVETSQGVLEEIPAVDFFGWICVIVGVAFCYGSYKQMKEARDGGN